VIEKAEGYLQLCLLLEAANADGSFERAIRAANLLCYLRAEKPPRKKDGFNFLFVDFAGLASASQGRGVSGAVYLVELALLLWEEFRADIKVRREGADADGEDVLFAAVWDGGGSVRGFLDDCYGTLNKWNRLNWSHLRDLSRSRIGGRAWMSRCR